ncbi:hypothetical protein EDB83DRAFT_260484 [Lactarius deliciosus]|nr:hypothetical protein EDB83DRAFT_260484 [Lactarius deliciosus]
MADNLILSCFIEGTKQPFNILIPRHSMGDALIEKIFNRECRDLAPHCGNLVVLKVNVGCDFPHLPLLRVHPGDEGVEEIPLMQTIGEIWQEPPPTRRIHVFVTFTNLPYELEGRRRLLEAAHLVYYQFWGRDVNNSLQPVPGYENIKYMTEELICSLGLREFLGYDEVVLLIREEYEYAYGQLRSYEGDPKTKGGGVVVLGQPGIGKTCFLYYTLFCLLSENKQVAFQMGLDLVLFTGTGVDICGCTRTSGVAIPSGTWALTDSCPGFEQPCAAFFEASGAGRAWIVQTTSPSTRNYSSWQKKRKAVLFWMQVFPLNELMALAIILDLDGESLQNNYNLWGPSARDCISLMKDPKDVSSHAQSVVQAVHNLAKDTSQFSDFQFTSTQQLFVIRPAADSRQVPAVEFGTNYLRRAVAHAYANHDHATRRSFYSKIRRDPMFSLPAGQIYEIHILLWFRHARNTEFLPCTSNVTGSPQLKIPACPGNLKFFSKPQELDKIYEPRRPICWVPTSETLPALGAIILTNHSVITVQISIASKHDAKNLGFEDIYRNLPPHLKTKPRCHVFITDSESNAESLQEQNLVPEGTQVFSAIADVEELDSKVAITGDRVEALEKDRVSVYWLRTIRHLLGTFAGTSTRSDGHEGMLGKSIPVRPGDISR